MFAPALLLFAVSISACAQSTSQTVKQANLANATERAVQADEKPVAPRSYIRVGHLFDSATGRFVDNVTLVVVHERVESLQPAGFHVPAGAAVIDLSQQYVLPGLIDCHTHLGARADKYAEIDSFTDTAVRFRHRRRGEREEDAGCGVHDRAGRGVRCVSGRRPAQQYQRRLHPGAAHRRVPGRRFPITGGHGDLNNYSPQTTVTMFPGKRDFSIADGPDEVRKTIREQVKYGVDVIKILASGGVLSKGDQPGAPQYTLEELTVRGHDRAPGRTQDCRACAWRAIDQMGH